MYTVGTDIGTVKYETYKMFWVAFYVPEAFITISSASWSILSMHLVVE